ncbi:MAG TPA: hypothetical protein EYO33_08005 [Phycisphaerales bacterium]|nr:hypothetical protein [Phycisphaerales bacterium]
MKTLLNSILARFSESRSWKSGLEACPQCRTPLEEDSVHAVKCCRDCSGVWVVPCLVKLLLTSPEKSVAHLLSGEIQDELTHQPGPKRDCPTCRCHMKNYLFQKESNLWLDACPKGCGVWFDSGEFALARRLEAKKQP